MLMASDYDGTVTAEHRAAFGETVAAIRRWRSEGHLFGIVTGRGQGSAVRLGREIGCDFVIACNGAVICDGAGRVLREHRAPAAILPAVRDYMEEHPAGYFLVCNGEEDLALDYGELRGREGTLTLEEILRRGDFHQFDALASDAEEAEAFAESFNRRFGDVLRMRCNGRSLDAPPAGVSKSGGVLEYLDLTGIAPDRVISCGDQMSDLDMLERFEGWAIRGGSTELLRRIPCHTANVAELIGRCLEGNTM